MSEWLEPVSACLDARRTPLAVFIRDDDAGWDDEGLLRLLEVADRHDAPLDLAVIPTAIGGRLARELRHRLDRSRGRVAVHRHGYAHVNHEPTGRKCEFGAARSFDQQRADLVSGRRRLEDALGRPVSGIFTPPWNRCTSVTVECLVDLGFDMLSCDITAPRFVQRGLAMRPVHLDWTGRHGAKNGGAAWGRRIAATLGSAESPVGIMLHHAVMTAEDRLMFGDLLAVLARHARLAMRGMASAGTLCSRVEPTG